MRDFRGLILGTTALVVAGVVPAGAMTLDEAAGMAVRTNPQMEAARENRRAQDAELRQGRGLYLPRLDLSAGVGPEWSQTETFGRDLMRYDTRMSLTQLLFDGFAREAKIEQRAARVDGAALRVAERVETISLDVSEAYLDVMRYQDLERLAVDNVAKHEDILGQVQERINFGQSGVGDGQQAQSRLAAARDSLVQTRQDLKDALARFERVVGVPADRLSQPPTLSAQLPATVEDAVVGAINNSPTLRATAAGIDEAYAQRREATASYYPTLELEVQHSRNHNVDGAEGINNDASALVNLTWNVFNGGIDEARRTEAAHRIGQARAETMDQERAVAEETKRSWHALEAARSRTDILREQVASNQEVVGTYRQEFTIGVRDLLDLLDSENELFLAQSALTSAEYVTEFATHRVLAVMGRLSGALGAPMPEEAVADAREGARMTPDYTFGSRTLDDVHRGAAADGASQAEAGVMEDGAALTVEEKGYDRTLVTVDVPVDGDPTEPPSELTATPLLPEGRPDPVSAEVQAVDGPVQPPVEPVLGNGSGAAPSGTVDVEQAIRNGDIRWNDPALQTEAVGSDQVGATGGDASAPASIKESDIIWNDPPQASEVPADIPDDSAAVTRTDESVAEAGSPGDAISPEDIIWNDPAPSVSGGVDQTATAPASLADTEVR